MEQIMTSIVKQKESTISKEIIVQNITEDTNTNAQAEECLRIKKYSSFKEKDISICEFIKRNYKDNTALQRETWMHVNMKHQDVKNGLERSKINANESL